MRATGNSSSLSEYNRSDVRSVRDPVVQGGLRTKAECSEVEVSPKVKEG